MRFIDRKAKYPGRWTMKKSDGSSEIITLIRNDEPIVEGTPMNANTLNTLSDVAGADVARAAAERSAALASSSEKNAKASEAAAGKSASAASSSASSASNDAKAAGASASKALASEKAASSSEKVAKASEEAAERVLAPFPMNIRKCRQSSRIPSWLSVPYNLSWMPCVSSMKRIRFYCRRWSTAA